MKETGLIVAGCRDFYDKNIAYKYIKETIDRLKITFPDHKIHMISGGASGADTLAEDYAKENNIEVSVFPANWKKYGRAAGPIRNQHMAEDARAADASHLLAFWDMRSPGTKNMINTAKKINIPVSVYDIKKNIFFETY